MKTCFFTTRIVTAALAAVALLLTASCVHAGPAQITNLNGDNVVSTANVYSDVPPVGINTVATTQGVFAEQSADFDLLPGSLSYYEKVYTPPAGKSIQQIFPKGEVEDVARKLTVLLSDGTVVVLDFTHFRSSGVTATAPHAIIPSGGSTWFEVKGDALYAIGASTYVSRDTGVTWQIDTAGFGSGTFSRDVSLDTMQNVYTATNAGLFEQGPDSSVWNKVTTLITPVNLVADFIDRKNRMFVVGNGGPVVLSTDNGSTWNPDTAGIGMLVLSRFCDDVYGNIYALGGSGTIYKSAGGTAPWSRIDVGISNLTISTPTVNGIVGDSAVVAATNFGAYVTLDQGTTWYEVSQGINAETFYGFEKTGTKRFFVSTSLGIFYKDETDTNWHKTFPPLGYLGSLPLYEDSLQTLYTVLPNSNPASTAFGAIYKSSDNGLTWDIDTLGLSATIGRVFFVDDRGGEHIGSSYYGFNYYARVYVEDSTGTWILDTSGIPNANSSSAYSFGTDRAGLIYLSGTYSGNPRVFHRPVTGGTWTVDTVGLPSAIHYFTMMRPGIVGEVFGSNGSSLYRHSGGVWNAVPLPGSSISKFTIDKSGIIFVVNDPSFFDVGISMSTDNGTTWTTVTTDTIPVQYIRSHGDTSYALLLGGGIYTLTKNGVVTGVKTSPRTSLPTTYMLSQNFPDPFNPTTTFTYQLPVNSRVSLKIYNVLGQIVATLREGIEAAGYRQVNWNATNLPSGVYFYRLQTAGLDEPAKSFVSVKKMVLLK